MEAVDAVGALLSSLLPCGALLSSLFRLVKACLAFDGGIYTYIDGTKPYDGLPAAFTNMYFMYRGCASHSSYSSNTTSYLGGGYGNNLREREIYRTIPLFIRSRDILIKQLFDVDIFTFCI
jgi:hypothetical protein